MMKDEDRKKIQRLIRRGLDDDHLLYGYAYWLQQSNYALVEIAKILDIDITPLPLWGDDDHE